MSKPMSKTRPPIMSTTVVHVDDRGRHNRAPGFAQPFAQPLVASARRRWAGGGPPVKRPTGGRPTHQIRARSKGKEDTCCRFA